MSDAASLLNRLIVAAEAALTLRSIGDLDEFVLFRGVLASEIRKPCDGERVLHDYLNVAGLAVQRAAEAQARYDRTEARLWCAIAGVILPQVRDDLSRAIELRKRGVA